MLYKPGPPPLFLYSNYGEEKNTIKKNKGGGWAQQGWWEIIRARVLK